jgi:hypothetical protein
MIRLKGIINLTKKPLKQSFLVRTAAAYLSFLKIPGKVTGNSLKKEGESITFDKIS